MELSCRVCISPKEASLGVSSNAGSAELHMRAKCVSQSFCESVSNVYNISLFYCKHGAPIRAYEERSYFEDCTR